MFEWSNHRFTSRRLLELWSGSPDSKCLQTNCWIHLAAADSDDDALTVDYLVQQTFGCTAIPAVPSRAHPYCFGEEYYYS